MPALERQLISHFNGISGCEDVEASVILEFLDGLESVYNQLDRDVISYSVSVGRIQNALLDKSGGTKRIFPAVFVKKTDSLVEKSDYREITPQKIGGTLKTFFFLNGLELNHDYTANTGGNSTARYHLEIPRDVANSMFTYRKHVGKDLLYYRQRP
jgi:hypothetical protein